MAYSNERHILLLYDELRPMLGTFVVMLVRCEGLEVSAKRCCGLRILSISRGILIFLAFYDGIGFVPHQFLGARLEDDGRLRCFISCERVFYKKVSAG